VEGMTTISRTFERLPCFPLPENFFAVKRLLFRKTSQSTARICSRIWIWSFVSCEKIWCGRLQTGLAMFLQAGGVAGLGKKEVFRADEGGNTKIFVHRDVSLKGLVVDKCHLPVMFLVEFSHSALMEKLSSKERQRKWEVSRK
jgi:hypothetical protein